MSAATDYITKARELMPDYAKELTEGITADMSLTGIDDTIFRRSEYLGGMAAVIIQIVKNSQPDSAS